ncbi:MAG TPA: carbohydrate ABC transporter permease [Defluviitoga sp.]|nr:carbohydrate ABC transporter permease [Defluviitoga sp.]HOP24073.1 carbohydrate ABC transporter permease [Defluviitoga sp.]HPZ28593.1 carbohydrate ABC transporter permease [Defluviitoga sp.]HQD62369.1 carbohydrate ABC transporter permease [Defluviitoga sp.]
MTKKILVVLNYMFLTILAVISIYPIFIMFISSFKTTPEIFFNPFNLPKKWNFQNFIKVWNEANFKVYFLNSVLITISSLIILLFCASLAAYALAKFNFKFNNLVFMIFLAGIMIPIRLGIVPLFILMRDLNLLDTRLSLIFTYSASGMPMSVFLFTGFFKTIPSELSDAARVDGCNEFQIFYKIMLPLVRPALATVALVNFVPWWNDFFFPLLFIRSDSLKTIQLGMTIFFGQYMTDWASLFAGMVIASIPMIILYLLMSKQFISGLTAGAVKG